MKTTIRCLAAAVALSCAFVWWSTSSSSGVALAQKRRTDTPVTLTRIYTGADGLTHSEETEFKMTRGRGGPGATDTSPLVNVTTLQFQRTAPKYFRDWHPASERYYMFTMFGRQNIELSDGTIVRLYPGHVLLVEDLKGKGHIERGVGTEDHVAALFSVPPQ